MSGHVAFVKKEKSKPTTQSATAAARARICLGQEISPAGRQDR